MKKLLFILLLIGSVANLSAQDVIKEFFLNAPVSITPLLSDVNKADFIDFLESGMKAKVKNRFGESVEMTKLTADFLQIKMSDRSELEMKIYRKNNVVEVIAVVNRVYAPSCVSTLEFYSRGWERSKIGKQLEMISLADFIPTKNIPDAVRRDFKAVDMELIKIELLEESDVITFSLNLEEYLEHEVYERISPYLVPTISYQWNGKRFKVKQS